MIFLHKNVKIVHCNVYLANKHPKIVSFAKETEALETAPYRRLIVLAKMVIFKNLTKKVNLMIKYQFFVKTAHYNVNNAFNSLITVYRALEIEELV